MDDLQNIMDGISQDSEDHKEPDKELHKFSAYPFPKKLSVALKFGSYKLYSKAGESETVEAENAKDAVSKSKLTNVTKIHYLGFIDKLVFHTSEFTENSGEKNEES